MPELLSPKALPETPSKLPQKHPQILFIHCAAPHGSINAQEGLDALLMGSAFADCAALFLGNGVLQLINEQDTTLTMQKNFSKTFGALADYGVNKAFCSSEQLESLGLNISDLIIPVVALSNDEVSSLIERSTAVLNF